MGILTEPMKLRLDFRTLVLACTLLLFTMGHGHGCCAGEDVLGPPTGATCPPTSTLTYDNFGRAFMESYCTRCHSSTLSGAARMGATADHDFDSKIGVLRVYDHVDQTAGSGPDASNDQMPPNGAMPSLAEREMLAEWLACGVP
jgi:cytochrome c5